MNRKSRWPVALVGLALGVIGGTAMNDRLIGQPASAPVMPREFTSYAPVVKKVVPAVVSIEAKTKVKPEANPAGGRKTQFQPAAAPPAPNQAPDMDPGFGSGFIIDPSGVLLTNSHVVEDTDSVEITLTDGRKFTSKDIRRDPKTDLAVVKFQAEGPLPFVEFGDSDAMEVGDRVLAVGAPFGLTGSVTHGIVSAKSRNNLRLNQFEDFVQTDAAVNPGNSGGPLMNLEGRVIGITSAIKTRTGGFQGVGLAVSSNLAKNVAMQLLKDGIVHRGYLGVEVRDVPAGGVGIVNVVTGGPAAKAKLASGDVITAIAGKPIKDGRDLQRIVNNLPLGQPAEIAIVRSGQAQVVSVVVEEQPTREPAKGVLVIPSSALPGTAPAPVPPPPTGNGLAPGAAQFPDLGLVLADLTPQIATQLRFPEKTVGVAILRIEPKSSAALGGLVRGVLVTKVDKTEVTTVKEFRQAIANADRVKGALLQTVRPDGESSFSILKLQ